jgi:SAM-dependent methyltransferase
MRGERVIERLYGRPLFEYFDQDREAGRTFHQGMTDLSTLDAPAIVDAYDFSGFGSVTDVGGGHGLLIATILGRHPHLRGMLYDRPEVVAGAAGGPLDAVRGRLETLGGDMFESVPAGADAYIMKYIIHDWPDDVSERILRHCRDGVNPGGRLLVVDSVVPEGPDFSFPKIADLEMMLFPGGKERTEAEFGRLFSAAGWQLQRIVPTASHVSIVEGIPA